MRALLLLFLAACDEPTRSPVEQCMAGAKSVDGVPCCLNSIAPGSGCSVGDHCIGEPGGFCVCENGRWLCGDPPLRVDLSVTSTD